MLESSDDEHRRQTRALEPLRQFVPKPVLICVIDEPPDRVGAARTTALGVVTLKCRIELLEVFHIQGHRDSLRRVRRPT